MLKVNSKKSIRLIKKIDKLSCSKAEGELTESVGALFATCPDVETIFTNVLGKDTKITRKWAWNRQQRDLEFLQQKGNLLLTLKAITYVPTMNQNYLYR